MQALTEQVLRVAPPGGLFDRTLVHSLNPSASPGARKQLVHRAVEHGEVLRLKPGLYLLSADLRRSEPHPYTLASMLVWPSHVSLQTALAYHGLIPEAVYQVASVTPGRSRTFDTPAGRFTFQRVPADDPRAGVEATRVGGALWAFVASPLRAIADLVYLTAGITWRRDGLRFLEESLRIEPDDLVKLSFDRLDEIRQGLRSRRAIDYLDGLAEEVA
jgi:hypothetical protein